MELVHQYERLISWIVSQCPSPDKFAHTYAGLSIWLLAAMIMRRKLSTPAPFLVVALAEGINEYVDRLAHGSWNWPDTLGDIAATLFWPLAIMLALRLRPAIRG